MRRAPTAVTDTDAYCPHCGLAVEQEAGPTWPAAPVRCPHCRLLIGTGRARPEPSGEPGTKGAAAGVLSRQARRDDEEGDGHQGASEADVLAAIRHVAADLGTRPERLLMVDYQQRADTDGGVPPLRDVFAHFKSWKRARRIAADGASASR
ncbi:MAG: hypothetical protein WD993_08305 [Thermoleophilaceae bacterium]